MENKNPLNWIQIGEHPCIWIQPYNNTNQLIRAETFDRVAIYAARSIGTSLHRVTVVFDPRSQTLRAPLAVEHERYRVRFVPTETYMFGDPATRTNRFCEVVRLAMTRTTSDHTNRVRNPERHVAPYWSFPIASWYVTERERPHTPDPERAPL